MGSLTWNGGSGDWSDPANWTVISGSDLTPGAGDDVTINAPGTYTITVTLAASVHDLTLNDANATLQPVGFGATLTTLSVGGVMTATAGSLDLTSGQLVFAQSQTLDNVTIDTGSALTFAQPFLVASGATLTLGPNTTITNSAGILAFLGPLSAGPSGTLVNEGTIQITAPFETVHVTAPFDNEGSISIANSLDVAGSLVNDGRISFTPVLSAGTMTVADNLSGDGLIQLAELGGGLGTRLSVSGTIGALQQIAGPFDGTFNLSAAAIDPSALISNFFTGSTIDLTALPYSSNLTASYSGNPVHGTLAITDSATSTTEALIQFEAIPGGVTFDLASDGANGTDITTSQAPVACFAAGTRIRTDRGEVAVEALAVGDRISAVRAGGSLPIVWIGHRRISAHLHPRPWDVYPVRVAAGAFADFVPMRDLLLSPEHCVFLHGVLVPVRSLINGTSITQEPCAEVSYWHVELASHDIMLCEGAWAESYLDMGNRSAFLSSDDAVVTVPPDFSREFWEARACQQQERGGPIVAAIRAAIDARVALLRKAA